MSYVQDFGAKGDGKHDDTNAIQHCVEQGDGAVEFLRGDYLITAPIELDTAQFGRLGVSGSSGTAKVIMAGAGPAFRVVGDHQGSASPATMKPEVWQSQRMPILENIEIEGKHEAADGVQLTGTVQAVIRNVGLRGLQHGIHLVGRNRNVIIDGCHIYHCTGAGIWMVDLNLHQINIVGSHISYNRLGGIRIERSEIRNLQITGNDIEYNTNNSHRIKDKPTAEIYIDSTAEGATVEEVTIASNTIQARPSPEGANIRIMGPAKATGRPRGLFAISGNVIGNQTNNIHLTDLYGVSISGNSIYSAGKYNVLLEKCRQIVLGGNHLRTHTPPLNAGIRVVDSKDSIFNGCQMLDESSEGQTSGLPLMELDRCQRLTISGCQLVSPANHCLVVRDSSDVLLSGCTLTNQVEKSHDESAIHWTGEGSGNVVVGCRIEGELDIADSAGVQVDRS